jgi:L-aminopeptidase/D-esterase-like protein
MRMFSPGVGPAMAAMAAMAAVALMAFPVAACAQEEGEGSMRSTGSITDVAGIEVGHHTLTERPTGCTVVLARNAAVGGVDVRGGAPGTRDTDMLDPVAWVEEIHGVVLSGGSLFGLDAVSGAVRWLEERGTGFDAWGATIPIVTGAILFDLGLGDSSIRPGPDCGYAAAEAATAGPVAEGSIGAGAGATVGKLAGRARAMKGGIGTASVELPDGVVVGALVAVNAVGDVVDPATGAVVAGIRTEDGTGFTDARTLIRSRDGLTGEPGENTTIGVVATNATLTKAQATKVAQMAHDGLARAVYPAHTPWDGDTIFALATGEIEGEPDLIVLGAVAADVVADAILRAVRSATGLEGVPSVSDLAGSR